MSILSRVRRLIRANIHDMLDRAEDPVRVANYLILEMQESIEQAREETATAMAAEKRLALQAEEAEQAADQWEKRARLAVSRGEDELAREALLRRNAAAELANQYHHSHREQVTAVYQLKQSLDQLQKKFHDAKARRTALLAQVNATRAQQVVARSLKQAVGDEAFATFDRLADQVSTERHRAIAISELSRDEVEDAFLVAEEHDAVEHELLAMKQEMESLQAPPAPKAIEEKNES